MVAPKGAYTPKSGPLAGQRFSSYSRYQTARAHALGFPSYSRERTAKLNPLFTVVRERAIARGESRNSAIRNANRIVSDMRQPKGREGAHTGTPRGREMREIIKQLVDEGYYDTGQEAADDLFYE